MPKEQVVAYENPSEQYLNLTGAIDEGLEYVVSVMYVKNAKESGCPTFGKDSDICQVKPEQFTYVPEIKEGSHSLHIPLKELSPGTNSWWEPHDISICVGPDRPKRRASPMPSVIHGHRGQTRRQSEYRPRLHTKSFGVMKVCTLSTSVN